MTWTTPRTWSDGELVTAALMNTHVRDNLTVAMHVLAYKSADETVNASAALQNDDHLLFAVGANEVWSAKFVLSFVSNTTADIKFAWTWPAATTATVYTVWQNAAGTLALGGTVASGTAVALQGETTETVVVFHGVFRTAGTAGNVQLQWAQNTSTAVNTVVKQGSCIVGMKLA